MSSFCIFYDGLIRATREETRAARCKAGVLYDSVRERKPEGGLQLPCVAEWQGSIRCPIRRFPTPEEIEASREAARVAFGAWNAKLDRNICPDCDRPFTAERQVGRCVYAVPCGHRLFQGQAA